ncbi:HEPN domain-containing protein [Nostoc sp. FACHB-110]|uniref:HEPN domain-containing protein n=1 Tax=Nostoc sp. FACHB-110 TaxID=2692834 RepID=UPI0016827AFB|nr:HEPN domain-containing protein [Nostoc sp. FACHB-110]MBD2435576.1 HEPN domain-containing protein [Nostoc sp. FACHB-110]
MVYARYQEQARSNEEAARLIEKDYPDWAVTMCFYAALHWVKCYAAQAGYDMEKLQSHDEHRGYLYDLAYEKLKKRELHQLYDDLHGASEKARYFKSSSHRRSVQPIRDDNAINYFRTHKREVNAAFDKLQQIKDILQIS